ncbi:MAG: HIT domain-containing protein, partial [Alphaproteobacteria bacterium]|nr:HIT domain-containing protein [Alphaproteobacteria bacterium]
MSLSGSYDPNNIFALILKGKEPCFRVYEDDVALAFMDIFPQAEGHTLIMPKKVEARHFLDLPVQEVGPYMARVQKVAQAMVRALNPDG